MNILEGKTILITGSSRGIGAATARLAKSYGADVIVHGHTDSDELKSVAEELGAEKIVCDLADCDAVAGAIAQLHKKDIVIDGLVNNAGIVGQIDSLDTEDPEHWMNIHKVNFLGVVYMCQELIPNMQKNKKGAIVNISSVRGHDVGAVQGRYAYSASKAGLSNFTVALAKEYAKYGIRVNAISPGGVETDIAKTWDEATKKRNANVLLARLGQPEEIGEAICFLLSDKASYITGIDMPVDGGYLISRS